MPVNPYFDFFNATNEQTLIEDLIIESIRMYGFDMIYLPATLTDFDEVFRESASRSFTTSHTIEAYLKSNLKFEGDGKFMSKELGLEIRDETTFTISQKVFKQITGMERPREGDVIFLPLDRKLYEVKFVDHQSIFYQLGKLNTYDLQLELLEYNGEVFNTGIPAIDAVTTTFDMDEIEENGIEDWNDQSTEFQDESNGFIDFSEKDPFANGGTL